MSEGPSDLEANYTKKGDSNDKTKSELEPGIHMRKYEEIVKMDLKRTG